VDELPTADEPGGRPAAFHELLNAIGTHARGQVPPKIDDGHESDSGDEPGEHEGLLESRDVRRRTRVAAECLRVEDSQRLAVDVFAVKTGDGRMRFGDPPILWGRTFSFWTSGSGYDEKQRAGDDG